MKERRIYVSGAIADIDRIRQLMQAVRDTGNFVELDWTEIPDPYAADFATRRRVAEAMKDAVTLCDGFLMLLPAGRGAHVEYGMALALNKPTLLIQPEDVKPCLFYDYSFGMVMSFDPMINVKVLLGLLPKPAPYGYCPVCGEVGVMRERRPDGNDKCEVGHIYPTSKAVKRG